MEKHLERECPECSQMRRLWETVAAATTQELAYEPSAEAVRLARTYMADAPPLHLEEAGSPLVLMFDSFREAAAPGVRGSAAAVRHLLYRSGTLWIDLRLEFTARSPRTLLVGQILDSAPSTQPLDTLQLWLIHDDERVRAAVSTTSGEFEFEFESDDDLELAVVLEGRGAVRIPLGDVTSAGHAPGSHYRNAN